MEVVILHSAIDASCPADDQETLLQAASVREALLTFDITVYTYPVTLDLLALKTVLQKHPTAYVVNLVESLEHGAQLVPLIPACLEAWGYRFTGAGSHTLALSNDKLRTKQLLRLAKLPTPDWITQAAMPKANILPGTRYIVKSLTEDASLGLDQQSVVTCATAMLARAAACTQQYGGQWFAEQYIDGREFNVSLLASLHGPSVLPIAEIVFTNSTLLPIVDYAAKWDENSASYQHTPRQFTLKESDPLYQTLTSISLACWQLFEAKGYARVDFRVDTAGNPWILEINFNPSLATDAGFAAAASQAGIDYRTLIRSLIEQVSS